MVIECFLNFFGGVLLVFRGYFFFKGDWRFLDFGVVLGFNLDFVLCFI